MEKGHEGEENNRDSVVPVTKGTGVVVGHKGWDKVERDKTKTENILVYGSRNIKFVEHLFIQLLFGVVV